MNSQGRILLLGNLCTESLLNALSSSGLSYVNKVFASSAKNWEGIARLLKSPPDGEISAVLAQFTESTLVRACLSSYSEIVDDLLDGISGHNHALLVYGANLRGDFTSLQTESSYELLRRRLERGGVILPSAEELRKRLDELIARLSAGHMKLIPYAYTSELTASSLAFLQNVEKGLVVRFYVPATRIYAREFDRFIELMQDYLVNVIGQAVSLEKRRTGNGVVYSFFSREGLSQEALRKNFDDIASLLTICANQPERAIQILAEMTIAADKAESLVSRYGREARRIIVDIDYERRSRLLAVEHQLHAELIDVMDEAGFPLAQEGATASIGLLGDLAQSGGLGSLGSGRYPIRVDLGGNTKAQVGMVLWDKLEGGGLTSEELELVKLIREVSGDHERLQLLSAFYELRDKDLDRTDRMTAWGRLQAFVTRISPKLGHSVLTVIENYVSHMLTRV